MYFIVRFRIEAKTELRTVMVFLIKTTTEVFIEINLSKGTCMQVTKIHFEIKLSQI